MRATVMRRAARSVLVGALVLGIAGCGSDGGTVDSADDAADSGPAESQVLALTVEPGAADRKCMVPNAEVLATQDTAFEGTVTGLSEGTATLSVQEWFAGDPRAEDVTVSTPSRELQDLLVAVDFEEGRTYLVSSLGGRVSLCGFTAESTPELEQLYADAFTG